MESVFFGYPGRPISQAEVMKSVADGVAEQFPGAEGVTWEQLAVSGRLIIGTVLDQIDRSALCVFDLTYPNENVLFEIGYAMAKAKPIWLTLDTTVTSAKAAWNDLAILKQIGYVGYSNSSGLLAQFVSRDPLASLRPIYDELIEPTLPDVPEPRQAVLYCPTFADFEASERLSRFFDDRRGRGLSMLVSDPSEVSFQPITWFAPNVLKSAGVVVHFAGKDRTRASTHNRRHAIIAGLATGLETPVLMLAEESYQVPLDYEGYTTRYETAGQCVRLAKEWLDGLDFEGTSWSAPRKALRSALSGLQFGEHVAENELSRLGDYFIETSAYTRVAEAKDTIFVGHRGTGKTANANQAFEALAADRRNLSVFIKPPGFEFPSLLAVLGKVPASQHDYFFDALWRFLIQTEIAATVLGGLRERSGNVPLSDTESKFMEYAKSAPFRLEADISVRLEQALDFLLSTVEDALALAGRRDLINEAFHSDALVQLRAELGPVLKGKRRVAVFVDNLDKGWQRGAEFSVLARLILGLLAAKGRVVRDFSKQDYWRDRVNLSVAVFLRSDIYEYVRREAREPDKLPVSTIEWRDRETLLTVVEARFLAGRPEGEDPEQLWTNWFAPHVLGVRTRDYIVDTILPRPRDIIYFCNEAASRAIDRRHARIEEEDVVSATETYSRYAYEALLVENGITIPEMEDAIFTFLGAPRVRRKNEIRAEMLCSGIREDRANLLIEKLISMSFLGLEVATGVYEYPQVGTESRRTAALASRLESADALQRMAVHRAFHAFLNICG